MSIPVLTQVYDEVRRLSIAGSVVAAGDFRMKKRVPPLEKAGQKAPVFAKVAQGVTKLVQSDESSSAEALLELSTLVNAILYTQGETGVAGKLEPIQSTDLGQQQTQTSARMLKPLLEALSTTGSGRLEIIADAHQRGLFRDLRLVQPALAAIDDPYPDVAEFVSQKVLPLYGKAILPELRDRLDLKGRGGHLRRLALIHRLDPEGSQELVQQALENGSKEMKVVAIECLGSSRHDLSFLLEQIKAKAKEVRAAALKALGRCSANEASQALCDALKGGDIALAIEPIRTSGDPQVLTFLLEQARAEANALLNSREKDKAAVGKRARRMLLLLDALRGRQDEQSEAFLLELFAQRDQFKSIVAQPGGKDIQQRLVSIMAGGSAKTQLTLADAHASLPDEELAEAFVAACRSRTPGEVFEQFSPYFTTKINEKQKRRDPASLKREAITEVLTRSWRWRPYHLTVDHDEALQLINSLDSRWLDLAVKQQQLELVQALAVPGHAAALKFLSDTLTEQLKTAKDGYALSGLLQTMIRVEHPAAADAVMSAISATAKSSHRYGIYWLGQLIPQLPPESLPKLEAWLASLPEKWVDPLVEYISQLKNRCKES